MKGEFIMAKTSFEDLLEKHESVSRHHKNLRTPEL